MNETLSDFIKSFKDNTSEIKKALNKEKFNLAEVDNLFRERNKIFDDFKSFLTKTELSEKEKVDLAKQIITDNDELVELMENKKANIKKEHRKKAVEISKISSYLKYK